MYLIAVLSSAVDTQKPHALSYLTFMVMNVGGVNA